MKPAFPESSAAIIILLAAIFAGIFVAGMAFEAWLR